MFPVDQNSQLEARTNERLAEHERNIRDVEQRAMHAEALRTTRRGGILERLRRLFGRR
jgi:hypothetical protein